MNFRFLDWLNLAARWFHVFAGILWVGATYYFTWLDGQFKKQVAAAGDPAPQVWMVHSGGFYAVERQRQLGVPAGQIHWFRWEALLTWVSGMVLLVIVYYLGGALVDESVANISVGTGVAVGLATLAVGWVLYDLLARSPLGKWESAFAAVCFLLLAAVTYGLTHVLSGRAAYIHVGALLGTIMMLNVWMRILPAQRQMIAAAASGAQLNLALGEQAKLRTKHNTFMAVPVVFLMISNHFPVETYGSRYNWLILLALVLAGTLAAKIIRRT
jgi:uncharacterized membrane protein